MAPIILSDVTKIYRGGAEVVRDVSFSVPHAGFCALIGPNGSGKSTLLRLIANLERVTSGEILIGEAVSQSWRLGRPEVAALFDARGFDPRRHVYDNMAQGLRGHGLKRKEIETRTLAAADRLGLGALMARKAGTISSGEAARVALGGAFAHQPGALLFDDPFARFDPAQRFEMRRALKRLQADERATIVLATNDHDDALALADVLVVMDLGRVVAAGPPQELYDRPATADLARLVGSPPMNVLPVRANQTGLSLEDGTHLGAASVMTTKTFALLGIRPEALFVAGEGAPPAAATLPVAVDAIERGAGESIVHGRVGPFPIVARVAGAVEAPSSGQLKLGARRESLHMFDAETRARL